MIKPSLAAVVLAGATLHGIVVAHLGGTQCHALLPHTRLSQHAVGDLPVAEHVFRLAGLGQRVHVGVRCFGAPGGITHATFLRRNGLPEGGTLVGVRLTDLHHLCPDVAGHEHLYIIRRCAHDAAGVEANHVGAPPGVVLVDEDGGVGVQGYNVGVVLHSHHIDSLAEGGVHVAQVAEAVGDGILADVDFRATAVVGVVLMEVVGKPRRVAVVVLVKEFDTLLAVPRRRVGTPGGDIADEVQSACRCPRRRRCL